MTQQFKITNARKLAKNSLLGFFDLEMPSGLKINGCMLFEKNGRQWVNFPSKEWTKPDGTKGYQMQAVAQRLTRAGVRMVEYAQSVPNLTESSTNLYELVKGRGIVFYPDADIRLAFNRAIALETTRGWRIAKEKASHKIDVVVALAMAAHGSVHNGQSQMMKFSDDLIRRLSEPYKPAPWEGDRPMLNPTLTPRGMSF